MTEELSSVVYIGHLPDGFEESQMRSYFRQFGKVVNVQLSRAEKSGNSRGYGWVQFETTEIAQIVAKATNKYLLQDHLLDCQCLPQSKVSSMLFKNARRGPKRVEEKPPLTREQKIFKIARQELGIMATLKERGVDYEWNSIASQLKAKGVAIPEKDTEQTEQIEKEIASAAKLQ